MALSAVLACELGTGVVTEEIRGKIDWRRAGETGDVDRYMSEIEGRLALFLNEDLGQVDKEIRHVAFLLIDAARKTLPLVGGGKKKWYKDEELKKEIDTEEANQEKGKAVCSGVRIQRRDRK